MYLSAGSTASLGQWFVTGDIETWGNQRNYIDIGLIVGDNPNYGLFYVKFYQQKTANTNIRVVDMNGKLVYQSSYPNFQGYFDKQVNLGVVSTGMYVVQILIGDTKYNKKIWVY